MSRIALTTEQRIEYKLLDFKRWVREQMARNEMTQESLGEAIGVSQGQVSQMLKLPSKKKKNERIRPDLITLGQALIIFDLFEVDEATRRRLLTL